ncbi:MAG: 2Fe-2S iron-sulfur cluster binding domain-containing protein [Alphaproteobacteria bacterium]|nr:2Fe-2S iron-sulfur cluster binding domain-containing protein [Alphaproteobacteria bacterium]
MATLRIAGRAAPIALRPDETLLQAALRAGADLPHGCRSGICGACRVAVVRGTVAHDPCSPAALTAGERAAGMALACRARAQGDVAIDLVADDPSPPSPRRFATTVVAVAPLTPAAAAVTLAPPAGGLAFLPGQYATLGFAGHAARDFSLASLPGDPGLVFHIRDAGPGSAGAHAVATARAGDPVTVEGPFGRAHLRRRHRGPLLLVAGGTGLGPMLAIARAALAACPGRFVDLCVGARDPAELYGLADIERLAARHACLRWHVALGDPGGSAHGARTAVDLAMATLRDATDGLAVHAAGPPAMIAALTAALAAAGVDPAFIHADAFRPATPLP